jgi:hypothetical protein
LLVQAAEQFEGASEYAALENALKEIEEAEKAQ